MQTPWLQHYPPGVPAVARIDAYRNLNELLGAAFQRFPTRDALCCMDSRVSFRQIDELSKALGAWLQSTGLEPGVTVVGLERPLSVTLGPNLLGAIFDGLLRPLSRAPDYQLQPGAVERSVARHRLEFAVRNGDKLRAGAVFARTIAPRPQSLLVPPWASGRVEALVEPGEYRDDETLLVLVDDTGRRA